MKECNYFTYDGVVYQHECGIAMGNPASPVIASILMDYLLDVCTEKFGVSAMFIKKYVDDLIAVVPVALIGKVWDTLNDFNPKIQFTIEYENENKLQFLDLLVIRRMAPLQRTGIVKVFVQIGCWIFCLIIPIAI